MLYYTEKYTGMTEDRRVVVVSGYYNPIHQGHIEYFRLAKEFAGEDGLVYAIVNSDKQSILKKKFSFVPQQDRVAVVGAMKYVDRAILSIDDDRTVCKTIQMLCDSEFYAKPTHFANGGDVTTESSCPENDVCNINDITLVYGLGDKIQSSSWILEKSVKEAYQAMKPPRAQPHTQP
jgi:D-beta-D-heptose 7-phosphate kinase/D-beta-D-heptose 1-phosphate adenosyltransferase